MARERKIIQAPIMCAFAETVANAPFGCRGVSVRDGGGLI